MANLAVEAWDVSKRYRLGASGGERMLREVISQSVGRVARAFGGGGNGHGTADPTEFWALKDVSFQINRGDVVGIIGRNGAGKSTLLKILSRITDPTEGRVRIHGRVGSLLEVGTGFHPELSGRENVFLNGAVLGMKRSEIKAKFDQIVDFSGVEQFIDTPVKRYSSGMYVRLAFAVAAHLEPEILIVDEVLAVGDAAFQAKCLGKMRDVAGHGRTVLFVSHNMAAVETLCNRGVVLTAGRVTFEGSAVDSVAKYFSMGQDDQGNGVFRLEAQKSSPPVSAPALIDEARVMSNGEFNPAGYRVGAPLEFHVRGRSVGGSLIRPSLGIGIENTAGLRIVTFHTDTEPGVNKNDSLRGRFEYVCRVPELALVPGRYRVKLSLESGTVPVHAIEEAMSFDIIASAFEGNRALPLRGVIYCKQNWSLSS